MGDLFYNSATAKLLNHFQVLQNRALRCIFVDILPQSNEELHRRANLLTLQQRRNLNLITPTHVRKIPQFRLFDAIEKNKMLPSDNKKFLVVPFANNVKYEKSFVMLAIKRWNSLNECYKILKNSH